MKPWSSICPGSAALRITARNESMNTSLGLVASISVTMAVRTFSSPSARSSSPRWRKRMHAGTFVASKNENCCW